MGWLDRFKVLLGIGKARAASPSLSSSIFSIAGYSGLYKRSPNGRWVVSWSDTDPTGRLGGFRQAGEGSYLLYDTEQAVVLVKGRLARPNNGCVANNGYFSLEDWHFGSGLSGTFSVFNSHGEKIYSKTVGANILQSGISSGGQYAFFQTANSPNGDGRRIFFIDVGRGAVLYDVEPLIIQPNGYEIDETTGELIASIKEVGNFRYDSVGNFTEWERLEAGLLASPMYEYALQAGGVFEKNIVASSL